MGKLYDLIVKQVNKELEHKIKGINKFLIASDPENHTWLIVDSCAAFRVLDPWIFDTEKLLENLHQHGLYRGITNMIKDFDGVPVKCAGTVFLENDKVYCKFINEEKPLGVAGYMNKKYSDLLTKLQNERICSGVLECDFEKCMFVWKLEEEPAAIILGYRMNR